MNTLQRAVSRCLNFFIRDILQSADISDENVRMWTVCPVCSGLRHCEHIITTYVNTFVCIYVCISEYVISVRCSYIEDDGKGEMNNYDTFFISCVIYNNNRNVLII